MIIGFDELKKYRQGVAMVDGCFDPLHEGHIRYFEAAANLGLPVLCNIASDEYLFTSKHKPLLPVEQRAVIINAIQYVDFVIINNESTSDILKELQPKLYIKGKDWEENLPAEEMEVCDSLGIEIIFVDTEYDSSTRILDDYCSECVIDAAREVAEFEELVFSQQPVGAGHYDDEYFTDDWRDAGNVYTLEARREIEARNPQLIKDVFNPQSVLDLGCGPGMLMYFLDELGVPAEGVDFSAQCRELAPEKVRHRIKVSSVTNTGLPEDSYDLVICREVLEHLTILQVRQSVSEMCRISSKYIYLTTRFHSSPNGLLSVTTQFDVDPTHITIMNKDFLRTLLVLEGFKHRPDLETEMDWANKGRVLVYEKQPISG